MFVVHLPPLVGGEGVHPELDPVDEEQEQWDAYYFRVILYIHRAMPLYFQNENNPRKEKERFAEMKALLRKEPFRTAIKTVPLGMLVSRRSRIAIVMLRWNLFWLYWLLKRMDV